VLGPRSRTTSFGEAYLDCADCYGTGALRFELPTEEN
jgi:hypothetical protein